MNTLNAAGFRITSTENGQLAWDKLIEFDGSVDLIITDIEMPQMDGHHLTKLIKTKPEISQLIEIVDQKLL